MLIHAGQRQRFTDAIGNRRIMAIVCCYLALACAWYMTGVVWFAQLVHYPLLDRGDASAFTTFARDYQRRTLWALTPALAGEIAGTVALAWLWPSAQSLTGLATLAAIWVSTCVWLIPAHIKLKQGYDRAAHRRLMRSNLPRAFLWTLRSLIMIWTTATLPHAPQEWPFALGF
jgi:hypothetical protein